MLRNMYHERSVDEKERAQRQMRPISFPNDHLSRRVDLRRYMSDIEVQGDMSTCAANAVAGICEYIFRRYFGQRYEASRLFMYYNGQIISQRTRNVHDLGVNTRDIILGIRKYGICEEHIWPYQLDLLNTEPSKRAYDKASHYTVVPIRIPADIKSIETCLHHQIPVLVDIVLLPNAGTAIYDNYGYLPMPNLNTASIDPSNIHAVLIVGYDRQTRHFIVRNSWGRNWGYRGYFHMPYDYLVRGRLFDPHDGLWSIMQIVKRGKNKPTIRLFTPSNAPQRRR